MKITESRPAFGGSVNRMLQVVVVLVLASAPFVACKKEQAAAPAAPPPVYTPPPAPVCNPIGVWNLDGPNGGKDQVDITQGDTPDTFVVHHRNAGNVPGIGTLGASDFKVDMSKTTMGLYTCKMNDACTAMQCGFGGAPAVMTKQ